MYVEYMLSDHVYYGTLFGFTNFGDMIHDHDEHEHIGVYPSECVWIIPTWDSFVMASH